MKTLSKICIVSLACLTACSVSAETSTGLLYGASADLFYVGSDPTNDLSTQAVENCRTGGGLVTFEKAGLFIEENANTFSGSWNSWNSIDLVFDPTINDLVPRFNISKNSHKQFFNLTEKLDHYSILRDVMQNNGRLDAVTSAISSIMSPSSIRP